MLYPTNRSVGIMGLGGLYEAAAHEVGHSFQMLSWASQNASGRWVRWGPRVLGPVKIIASYCTMFSMYPL
jgi:hypothetical protein